MARESRTLKLSILADVDELKKSLNIGAKDVDGFAGKIGDFSKKAALAFAAAAAAAGAMAVKIGVDAVKAASDLGETISKVNVLFGDTAQDIEKFAEGAASSLGQTKQQALDAAATFATFGKSAGLSGQDLSKFSTDFVKLASDLASFNNTTPEQAINAIGSALRGEAEPLRAYGVLLDDASLRQSAFSLGIIKTTKEALTPQQKVLAAQALIYQQTGAAQGDFERTSDGLANKTRILTAQLENAKTTIGTALLPIVLELATAFSEKVIPFVEKLTEAFSDKSGNLGAVVTQVGNTLQNTFTPIINGLVKAFGYVRDAIGDNLDEFKQFGGYIADYLAPIIGTVLGGALQLAGKIAGGVINVIGGVVEVLNNLIAGAIAGINALIAAYNAIPFLQNISPIKKPVVPVIKPVVPVVPVIKPVVPIVPIVPTVPDTTVKSDGSTTKTTVVDGVGTVSKKAVKAITDIAGAFDNFTSGTTTLAGVMAASTRGFPFGTSGVNTNTLGGILAASNSPVINLTVNGAIDSEGTARTIVDTLNNSFYRGTLGAGALVPGQ